MKKTDLYSIIKNTASVLLMPSNILVLFISGIFFAGFIAFFYGLFTIPVPGGVLGFYRMEAPTTFEYSYLIFSTLISSLVVTITVHAFRIKLGGKSKGQGTSALGLTTGVFGAVCPACLGINFLAFGNVFTTQLAFLIPYIFWIQITGIILLTLGLYLVARSAYLKECIVCRLTPGASQQTQNINTTNKSSFSFRKLSPALLIVVVLLFAYQVTTVLGLTNSGSNMTNSISNNVLVTDTGEKIDIKQIIETVTPEAGFETTVLWGDVVPAMIKSGALDPEKLKNILTKRYGQTIQPEWQAILNGENVTLSINNDNAVFMMYMLWALAQHNKNQILADSPIAKYFTNYDIGVGNSGYNDIDLLELSPEQQTLAKNVSENAYRPCCGNSTAVPDCSHGYSALGLVQLMAQQGFSEKEIFDTFVKFNSFWFPETYIKTAMYFKIKEGTDWNNVDKKLVAGKEYSTLRGSFKAKQYLKQNFGI